MSEQINFENLLSLTHIYYATLQDELSKQLHVLLLELKIYIMTHIISDMKAYVLKKVQIELQAYETPYWLTFTLNGLFALDLERLSKKIKDKLLLQGYQKYIDDSYLTLVYDEYNNNYKYQKNEENGKIVKNDENDENLDFKTRKHAKSEIYKNTQELVHSFLDDRLLNNNSNNDTNKKILYDMLLRPEIINCLQDCMLQITKTKIKKYISTNLQDDIQNAIDDEINKKIKQRKTKQFIQRHYKWSYNI